MNMSNFDRVIDHLGRFPSEDHDDLIETLVQSPRVAQLASSYPLLVLLLAKGYGSAAARKEAVARANDGASLGKIAEALSLPLSLRRVPPEACINLPFAPWTAHASRELASLIPNTAAAAASWLKTIFNAHIRCDEAFALWLARQRPLFTGRQLPELPLQGLAAYAWCSRHSPIPIDEPLTAAWQPDMGLDTACSRAGLWAREIAIVADLSPSGLPAAWVPQAELDGLLFTPILTPESLIAEARVMANCVVSYSDRMAKGSSRLYSATRNGRRVATVEIIWSAAKNQYGIHEIRGPRNVSSTEDVVRTAYAWLHKHAPNQPPRTTSEPSGRNRLVAALLAPYLAAHPGIAQQCVRNALSMLLHVDLVRAELWLATRAKS